MKLQRFGALTAVLAGVAFMGCSSDQSGEIPAGGNSSIDFALTTVEGVVITSVNYDLNTQAGADVVDGSIPVPDPESTISLGIQSLGAGAYALAFSATGLIDGESVPCASAPTLFTLAADQNLTLPTITMTCTVTEGVEDDTGSVNASVEVAVETITVGTTVETFTYGPTSVRGREDMSGACVFPPVALKVVNSNSAITYSWSSADGTFALNALNTEGTYTCTSGGTKTLTVTATEGTNTASKSVSVTCDATACDVVGPVCGNGTVEGTEECDEATARCVNCEIVPQCGDGIVDAPEQCDDAGPSATCDVNCQTIEPGSPCIECLSADPETASYQATACDPFAECAAAQECVLAAGCFSPAPIECYCGSDIENCDLPDFVPVGPCAAEIKAGTGGTTTSNEDVLLRFFDLSYPAGAGLAIINAASTDAECGPVCAPEL